GAAARADTLAVLEHGPAPGAAALLPHRVVRTGTSEGRAAYAVRPSLQAPLMSGRNRLLALALLLFPLGAALAAEAPHALLAEETYDFGKVKQGVHVVHAFTVKNTDSAALRIERADFSRPGMTARFKPEIPP